jgi:DNA mismatch repair protein MutH
MTNVILCNREYHHCKHSSSRSCWVFVAGARTRPLAEAQKSETAFEAAFEFRAAKTGSS